MRQTAGRKSFQIEIRSAWCKGCTLCVLICPKKVFETNQEPSPSGYFTAKVHRPGNCTGCLECELHCPDLAIEIKSRLVR